MAEPMKTRYIVVGTGHVLPTGAKYVGTTLAEHGLVRHLYELASHPEEKSDHLPLSAEYFESR